jgi:zinc protease
MSHAVWSWVPLVAVVAVGGGAVAAPARSSTEALRIELKEWRLGNGLRVIYSPHRRVPAVTVQVWYHVGSKDEASRVRGLAHLFEHMMFKGSLHVPPEQHARLVQALGGENNAFTTEDLTAYHNTLPRQYLQFALRLEAERMRSLHLTPKTIRSEREVVKEEKRMRLENNPIARALEAIRALAYTVHPYSWTPAGDIPQLNRVTLEQCRSFYNTYYTPQNATLVVVGDVDEAEVRQEVQRSFGAIAAGMPPARITAVEPPQTALREQRPSWPSQLKVVLGAYHIPEAKHDDIPALKVLSAILSAGRTSRLNQALVRKGKLAVAAASFVQVQENPGLLMIYGVGLPSHDAAKIRETLLSEVERLASAPVAARELVKVRNQLATSHLAHLDTLNGLADRIGTSVTIYGDPRAFLGDVARLDRVSAADVRRVARTYLRRTNLSLVTLDTSATPPAAQRGGQP